MKLRLSENYSSLAADPATIATTAIQVMDAAQQISEMFGGGAEAEKARFTEVMKRVERNFPVKTTMSNNQLAAYIIGFEKEMKKIQQSLQNPATSGGQKRVDARFYKAFEIQLSKALELANERGYSYSNGSFTKVGPANVPIPSNPDSSIPAAPGSGLNIAGVNIPSWLPLLAIGGLVISKIKF